MHVNNAVYATYLEECRDEWVDRALGELGDAWDFVLARVAIDFRRELRLEDEEVVVSARSSASATRASRLSEEIRTREGELSAEAEALGSRVTASSALSSADGGGARGVRGCSPGSVALAIGPVELPNRIVSTAHQTTLVHEHLPTDDFVAYHEARARGGVGLIVLEAPRSTRPVSSPRTRSVATFPPPSTATGGRGAVQPHGTRLFVQLFHGGREQIASASCKPALAPSAVPSARFWTEPRAARADELEEIVAGTRWGRSWQRRAASTASRCRRRIAT